MISVDSVRFLTFQQNGDDRGHLVIVEGKKHIPFDIKRVFYMYGSDRDVIRGRHANRVSQFVLINVSGQSKVRVDDGEQSKLFVLEQPHTGIYIPQMIWKDMFDFSADSVLLVLASELYDPQEYLRDYEQYVIEKRSTND